jgi:hypothetical protein
MDIGRRLQEPDAEYEIVRNPSAVLPNPKPNKIPKKDEN